MSISGANVLLASENGVASLVSTRRQMIQTTSPNTPRTIHSGYANSSSWIVRASFQAKNARSAARPLRWRVSWTAMATKADGNEDSACCHRLHSSKSPMNGLLICPSCLIHHKEGTRVSIIVGCVSRCSFRSRNMFM